MSDNAADPSARSPRPRWLRFVPAILIVAGLLLTAVYGVRTVRSFRQLSYIQQQGLDQGTASVDAIQPWMTIRFVAVAYAVPEEYLYSALDIPFNRRNADRPLGRIQPTPPPRSDGPPPTPIPNFGTVIVDRAKEAVLAWRADPVATGLREVRGWMSLRYISNSMGVPLEELFAAAGLPETLNPDKPLSLLAEEENYPGGPRALEKAVADALGVAPGGGRR